MDRDRFRATITPLVALVQLQDADRLVDQLVELTDAYAELLCGAGARPPDEGTAVLITYGGSFCRSGEAPLTTLRRVLEEHVDDAVSHVHLLPMFPYTSDDGFAVVDHRAVDPELGTWADVTAIGQHYQLVFDFVANHVSSACEWFVRWLDRDPRYEGYFIELDPRFDTARVTRPRTTPLFHEYRRPDGAVVAAWTTFGEDQVDVNVARPEVLLELTDVLLGYLRRGATTIRLDAVGFLWKQSGTSCLHLTQTHAIVKLWRAAVERVQPGTQILTETNVPHAENVEYFGNGHDEANLVYQFALPPLVLHSFTANSTARLSAWAESIAPVSPTASYFNFLASHDGIGMRATEGILTDPERQSLVDRVIARGGRASMATRPDGSQALYELNINYLDALASDEEVDDPRVIAAKGLAAHSILFSVVGVPALYYHSFFGSSLDVAGMEASGISRRINREVLDADRLAAELREDERRRVTFSGLAHMLRVRRGHRAFSPYAPQSVEHLGERLFSVRRAPGTDDEILSVTNVTCEPVDVPGAAGLDVLTGQHHDRLRLPAYGYAWVRPGPGSRLTDAPRPE